MSDDEEALRPLLEGSLFTGCAVNTAPFRDVLDQHLPLPDGLGLRPHTPRARVAA